MKKEGKELKKYCIKLTLEEIIHIRLLLRCHIEKCETYLKCENFQMNDYLELDNNLLLLTDFALGVR